MILSYLSKNYNIRSTKDKNKYFKHHIRISQWFCADSTKTSDIYACTLAITQNHFALYSSLTVFSFVQSYPHTPQPIYDMSTLMAGVI